MKKSIGKKIDAYLCTVQMSAARRAASGIGATVEVEYEDGSRDEILRVPLRPYEPASLRVEVAMGKAVLERFTGRKVSAFQALELVRRPGKSLCRIDAAELERFTRFSHFKGVPAGTYNLDSEIDEFYRSMIVPVRSRNISKGDRP